MFIILQACRSINLYMCANRENQLIIARLILIWWTNNTFIPCESDLVLLPSYEHIYIHVIIGKTILLCPFGKSHHIPWQLSFIYSHKWSNNKIAWSVYMSRHLHSTHCQVFQAYKCSWNEYTLMYIYSWTLAHHNIQKTITHIYVCISWSRGNKNNNNGARSDIKMQCNATVMVVISESSLHSPANMYWHILGLCKWYASVTVTSKCNV